MGGGRALSLTLAELVERTGDPPKLVARVLAEEIVLGRAVLDRDGYKLVPEAFAPEVLAALRALALIDPDESRPVRRSRQLARATVNTNERRKR